MNSGETIRPAEKKIRIGFKQTLKMVLPYARNKIVEQIKSVWLIIVYLILFLCLVLRIPVPHSLLIAAGMGAVIIGLSFFMEGLLLGLMPLGEIIGLKLPQTSRLPAILAFAFILGMGVTFAEPAVGILKTAGSSVSPWNAPLLFVLLNKYSPFLVYAIAIGVGLAVMFGMLRFIYNWSLKPFIYTLVGGLAMITLWAAFDPNLRYITGVAWDCGGVTTGPVTVPLVLALGIGICRVVGRAGSESAGFGVVTLASLLPVLTVMTLGMAVNTLVPPPMSEAQFFSPENREQVQRLFKSREDMLHYAFLNSNEENQALLFDGGRKEMLEYLRNMAHDVTVCRTVFGPNPENLFHWAAMHGSPSQRSAVFGSEESVVRAMDAYSSQKNRVNISDLLKRNGLTAVQAIVPLSLFLIVVLVFVIRDKIPRADEVALGLCFALAGMMLFNIGIEAGLGRLGNQVGDRLPALFMSIPLTDQNRTITNFDRATVQTAITQEGRKRPFFYFQHGDRIETLPFQESGFDSSTGRYTFIPTKGPLLEGELPGIIILLLFAFILGYGATLAEPALNALGYTVEKITVGTFKKSLLMQSVAVGVGAGIAVGVARVVWSLPLVWLIVPPYLILLLITWMSTEEFVNIGWDSAGVTTGPVTVPLVLAMGLGIGNQIGVVEGFGILAMASIYPILTVLAVGLFLTRERKADLSGVVPEISKDRQ